MRGSEISGTIRRSEWTPILDDEFLLFSPYILRRMRAINRRNIGSFPAEMLI